MDIFEQLIDSDEDQDIRDRMERMRKTKRFRERIDYLQYFDEDEFFKRFRLTKRTFMLLLEEVKDEIQSASERNNALSPSTKLMLTLRFFATGCMLITVADFAGVSKTSACVTVKQVSTAIAGMLERYVHFPRTEDGRRQLQLNFYGIAKFPNVVGALDCTHIKIQSPGGNDAEYYRNRKGYFSWNVQAVCDEKLRFQDVVVRWPGSTHDQTIFNNSRLKARMEVGEFENGLLLADSGYGVANYLITPLLHPATAAENLFNESQIRTRNAVERCFGVWKRRFPILSLGMRVSKELSKIIVVATAVLHNIAVEQKEGQPPDDGNVEVNEEVLVDNVAGDYGNNTVRRRQLIDNHFQNLL